MDWRNPFEDWRDKYTSFSNVKARHLLIIRCGYIPYSSDRVVEYDTKVREMWRDEDVPIDFFLANQTYRDLKVKGNNKWITKFFNARFSFNIGESMWRGWLPLPFIGIVIRFTERRYFQCGLGFGPEGKYDEEINTYERATLCGKFRLAEYKGEWYKGGNFDVYGFYEGIC